MIRVLTARQFRDLDRYRLRAFGEKKRREQVEADRERLYERIRELEARMDAMKQAGFEVAPEPPQIEDVAVHSAVLEALDEVAPPGSPYRQQEFAAALADLEQGVQPGEVAERMRRGGNVNIWRTGRLREVADG